LSSIEPKYVTDELIGFMSNSRRICRHLHIPLQSGDDSILERMNRPYTSAEYRNIVDRLRRVMDGIAITTDVMVGFPGETDKSFQNTLNFIKSILPARIHIFKYSKREVTSAAVMDGNVNESVVKRRYCGLKAAATMASYIYRAMFDNRIMEVLVESRRDRNTGLLTGYSGNYIKILFEGTDDLMGKIVPVKITELNLMYTKGTIAQ
jgi:threonylcarbamoyladenosine tRNA methylthiotransferase MtaB